MRKIIAAACVAASALFMSGQPANAVLNQGFASFLAWAEHASFGGCWGVCGQRIYVENIAPGPGHGGFHNGGSVSYSRNLYCWIC